VSESGTNLTPKKYSAQIHAWASLTRVNRPLFFTLGIGACLSILSSMTQAHEIERYQTSVNGTEVEISAPREDIIRVRMGQKHLPEDASWAVIASSRAQVVRINHRESATEVTLSTNRFTLRLNRSTLALDVTDVTGHSILSDARIPIRFDDNGYELHKKLPEGQHIFGLGDKTGPVDRLGRSFVMWNTDAYGFDVATDPLYKSIPFYLAINQKGQSYGLFLDNTYRTQFDFGSRAADTIDIRASQGPLDYYILIGPNPKDVIQQFSYLVGAAPLTPRWALGFQQSHYSYPTRADALAVAKRLRAEQVPLDAIYLDIGYQDRNRPFTTDPKAFYDLPGLVHELKDMNVNTIVITDLHIAKIADGSYAPYQSGVAANAFLKNPDGSTYVAKVWPGDAVFPDFSRYDARRWWGSLYRDFYQMGIAGFWNDMNEPAIFDVASKTMPLDVVHQISEPGFTARATDHAEMHNVYGQLNSRATYEGLLALKPDQRPFVLTRATYAGGQRYAATWTGDNVSTSAHVKLSIAQLINLGLSGFSYAGDDIGGFTGPIPSAELLTKWIEVGAFNPIFRVHSDNQKAEQEVFSDGAEHEQIRCRYINERYRLMPYLYGLAEENSRTGLPILRPVFLEFPETMTLRFAVDGTNDQFLLGPDLLIALPWSFESHAPYTVHLPSQGWYDYWSNQRQTKATVTELPSLQRLAIYIRPGALLTRQPLTQSTGEIPVGALSLDAYLGADHQASIYWDDGLSFGYRRGEYVREALDLRRTAAGDWDLSIGAREGHYQPWWHGVDVTVHGVDSPMTVSVNGKAVNASFNADKAEIRLHVDDTKPVSIHLAGNHS